MHFIVVSVLIFLTVKANSESPDVLQFGNIIKELQAEMTDMRKVRQQDSETIRKLQEKVHLYVPKDSLVEETDLVKGSGTVKEPWRNVVAMNHDSLQRASSDLLLRRLDRQFQSFRSHAITAEDSKPDLRTESDYLRQELLRLSKQIEDMKFQKTEEPTVSSSRVAVRWLQRTVEGLRHEMREMAKSVNTSEVLADKQRTLTNFALLKSDVVALGHRMDGVRVDGERNAAVVKQLRQDVDEMRKRLQESAMGQQKLVMEMDALKEELREQILLFRKKNSISEHSIEHSNKEGRSHTAGEREHPRFRHSHWKIEAENLQESVNNLEYIQTDLSKQLQAIANTQTSQVIKLNAMEKTLNRSENPLDVVEQRIANQRLDVLESLVNKTERQTLDIQSRVNNITTSGIKKLHGSTIQLFNALERLESNYDRTTDDIRKEISKLDYNLSQTQSDLEELRDREISSEQVISNMKNDVNLLQSDMKSNHVRILLVQNAVLNRTLQTGHQSTLQAQDAKISTLETQIKSLSDDVNAEKMEIAALHRQVIEKADDKDLTKWERAQRKVRESILQFKEDIPRIKRHQDQIEQELEMFILQLPRDCSGNSSLEEMFDRQSGTYLIRHPTTNTATKVFCDMDTSGGHWTVIQRRSKGDQNFNKDWIHYKDGFGDVTSGDFWLGNEILHQLTTSGDFSLRVDMWDSAGKYKYAEYSTFQVLDEKDNFRLVLAGYSGNASDAMNYHNGMAFSTPDRDNDASSATHCADFYNSGWWYNHCQYVNINGRYNTGITWYDIDGQEWSELTKVEMKIKPRNLIAPPA